MTCSVMKFESRPNGMDVSVAWTGDEDATDEEKRLAEGMVNVLKYLIDSGILQARRKGGAE